MFRKLTLCVLATYILLLVAMPLKDNQIFFEETSLVARPAVSFQDCKDRCYKRLAHLGITVTKVYEEEFCYIPMGGALPAKDQRVIGLGGAAAMVHPSTGYHLCRCLLGAADLATTILRELDPAGDDGDSAPPNLDRIAALAYDALWSPETIRQRNFAVFGGEYLMKQNVVGLRGFFDGFFQLPLPLWAGFLAGWPGLPNNDKHESWVARLWFGLVFVSKLPLSVAVDMFTSIVTYSLTTGAPLPQSVTPLFGVPASYADAAAVVNEGPVGDVAAKEEAWKMLTESKVEKVVPVAFVAASTETAAPSVVAAADTAAVAEDATQVEETERVVTEEDDEPEASDDEPQLIEVA
jgi:lycopene beta-cyclase